MNLTDKDAEDVAVIMWSIGCYFDGGTQCLLIHLREVYRDVELTVALREFIQKIVTYYELMEDSFADHEEDNE